LFPESSAKLKLGNVLPRSSKDIANICLPCLLSEPHAKLSNVRAKAAAKLSDLGAHAKQALSLLCKELLSCKARTKQACPKLLLLQRLLCSDVLLLLGEVLGCDSACDVRLFLCPR